MNQWAIRFLGKSQKQFCNLDKTIQISFKIIIEELIDMEDPTLHLKSKALRYGHSGYYRIKLNKYRMMYSLNTQCYIIEIEKFGIRDKFYIQ